MRDFLNKLRESHLRFMRNRYGGDQLGLVIVSLSLVCTIITWLTHWRWLSVVSLAALAFELWRMYSRDIPARARENQAYLDITEQPRSWIRRQRGKWANRKVKAYVRCPHCHAEFALPKGKGKLRATCPKCGKKSEHTV